MITQLQKLWILCTDW